MLVADTFDDLEDIVESDDPTEGEDDETDEDEE